MPSIRDEKTGRYLKQISGKCLIEGCWKPGEKTGLCKQHYNAEAMRLHRLRHPEKRNQYWAKHKDKIKAQRGQKREIINKQQREWRKNLRVEVMTHYSEGKPKCNICGFDDIRALCVDHINNDGNVQRRLLAKNNHRAGNGVAVLIMAKREGYPPDLQVLCSNCNRIKEYEKKEAAYATC